MRRFVPSRWVVMAIVWLSMPSREAPAQCDDERIEPPGAVVHGKTVGEWTAVCWQWLAGIPEEGHPLLELEGAQCAREQDEPVFFLPGSLIVFMIGDEPYPRTQCVVPCGKPILLGLSWQVMWAPGDCEPDSMQDCVALARSAVDEVTDLEATLDGVPLPCPEEHREISPAFDFTVPSPPESNIFLIEEEPFTRKGVADGHWIMLKPLSPGKHTIFFSTVLAGLELPLLYELTVAPCDGASFRRGDADGDQAVSLTDAVHTLDHLFRGGSALPCDDAADADDNGLLDLSDPVHTLNHLFLGGPTPPAPGPDECGADPTQDDLRCESRGCEA